MSDVRIVVPLGENLALFGQAERTGEGLGRQRENTTSRRTAAAAESAAATMEKGERHAKFVGSLLQLDLRLEERPLGRDVPAILRAVGVADHDHLLVLQTAQMFAVGGLLEHRPEGGRRPFEVIDRFEQRHDGKQQLRVAAMAAVDRLRRSPEPEDGEHIARILGHADDMTAEGAHAEPPADATEQGEQFQRFSRRRGPLAAWRGNGPPHCLQQPIAAGRFVERLARLDDAHRLPQLVDHAAIDARVLADVEPLGMKAEEQDLVEPWLHLDQFGVGVTRRVERLRHDVDVGPQFFRRSISANRQLRLLTRQRNLGGPQQPPLNRMQPLPVRLKRPLSLQLFSQVRIRGANLADRIRQRGRRGRFAIGDAQKF